MTSASGGPYGITLPESELPTEATPPLPGHAHHSGSRLHDHSTSLSNVVIAEDAAGVKDVEEADTLLAEGGDSFSVPPTSKGLPKPHPSGGGG